MPKVISKKIPTKMYRKIYESMPILCVDLVVTDRTGKYFFLVKRDNKPERGKWWFPGGRVYKNEFLHQAVRRKLREETNLTGTIVKQIDMYDYRSTSQDGFFKGVNVHTLNVVFLVKAVMSRAVQLDTQSSDYGWFKKVDPAWSPYVKEFLRKAGFK